MNSLFANPNSSLISLVLAFTAVTGLSGCGKESEPEVQRKPPLVDAITKSSLAICDTGTDATAYTQILRDHLNKQHSRDLDRFINYEVTPCIDDRLLRPHLNYRLLGVYYADSRVVSIISIPGEYSSLSATRSLFYKYLEKGIPTEGGIRYAGSFKYGRYGYTDWRTPENFYNNLLKEKDTDLIHPPLKPAVPAP